MTAKPIDIKVPDFKGKREESQGFFFSLNSYLSSNANIYNTDLLKVYYALSRFTEGDARLWALDVHIKAETVDPSSITATQPNGTLYGYPTWANFKKDFKKAFSPVDSVSAAMAKLQVLHQGYNVSVSNHLATFNNLASTAEITHYPTRRDYFMRSLRLDLSRALITSGRYDAGNWDELVDNLLTTENNLETFKALQNRNSSQNSSNSRNQGRFQNNRPRYNPTPRDPNAMDIDAITMPFPKKLTQAGRDWCIKNNACFQCRQIGHAVKDCKVRFEAPAKTVTKPVKQEKVTSKIEEFEEEEEVPACRTATDF